MDIGTGWFHQDAFLLYLLGDYRFYLFDVKDKAKLVYIKRYLEYLQQNVQTIAAELDLDQNYVLSRLARLQSLHSKRDIYRSCNFTPCITRETGHRFLPGRSIDFMFSFCVPNYIPVSTLVSELIALRKMLKNDGRMYHYIGHIDHWAYHDPSANEFNYYPLFRPLLRACIRKQVRIQNRPVKREWFAIFEECGLDVEEYAGVVTGRGRDQISRLSWIPVSPSIL